jgi:iron complex outermembrane receptor protein
MGDDYYDAASLSTIIQGAPLPADVFYSQKPYTLVNGRIQLDNIAGTGFSAAIWGRNLFNQNYVDSAVPFQNSIGFGVGIYGPPRTFGLDVSLDF